MNIRKLIRPVGATAIAVSIAAATVVPASAVDNIQPFGKQELIKDYLSGAPVIGYTVMDLKPSSDPVPAAGRLFEATMKVDAPGGWATPMIPLFMARAENSQAYRVVANAPSPQALPGGAVPPGGSSTGKLYFDVVGADPNSVVYNDGIRDVLAWVP
jgi:Domain of unknown function (DUF1942)